MIFSEEVKQKILSGNLLSLPEKPGIKTWEKNNAGSLYFQVGSTWIVTFSFSNFDERISSMWSQ